MLSNGKIESKRNITSVVLPCEKQDLQFSSLCSTMPPYLQFKAVWLCPIQPAALHHAAFSQCRAEAQKACSIHLCYTNGFHTTVN